MLNTGGETILKRCLVLTISLSMLTSVTSYAETDCCEYGSLPVDSKYTEQGFIWYRQSDYQEPGKIGYWEGFLKSYYGKAVNMPHPTSSGCGPISMACIVTNVKQDLITPADTIQWYCDTGYYTGAGSSHSSGRKAAEHYGLSYETPNTPVHGDRMLDMEREVAWMRYHLERGHWIQILVKGSPNIKNSIWPYNGGHFVAIHGYLDGNTFIYDSSREDLLEKPMSLEEVWMNIRNPLVDGCGATNHMTAIW